MPLTRHISIKIHCLPKKIEAFCLLVSAHAGFIYRSWIDKYFTTETGCAEIGTYTPARPSYPEIAQWRCMPVHPSTSPG